MYGQASSRRASIPINHGMLNPIRSQSLSILPALPCLDEIALVLLLAGFGYVCNSNHSTVDYLDHPIVQLVQVNQRR